MPNLLINGKNLAYEEFGTGFPLLFGHSYLWSAPAGAARSGFAWHCVVRLRLALRGRTLP